MLTIWQKNTIFVKNVLHMKKLLTTILLFAGLGFGWSAFAQDASEAGKPYKVYCEIVSSSRGIFSDKTSVDLDFGQYASWWSADRKLVDENGKTIIFNSVLDAVNYMARRGWTFEQMYIVQSFSKGDSDSPAYHWIMSKMVTSDAQIMEGLSTQGSSK